MKEQRLTILKECEYISKSGKKLPGYLCICKCGNKKIVSKSSYDNGKTRSCGCLVKDFNSGRGKYYEGSCYNESKIHGVNQSMIKKIRNSYKSMIARCQNPHNENYKNYGGRGITVCDEWVKNKSSFIQWALENGFEEGKSIDRIDVNGNYEPSNCRWATPAEQANNTRSNVHIIFNGKDYTITALSRFIGIDYKILSILAKNGIELQKNLEEKKKADDIPGQTDFETDFPEVMP